MTHLLGLALLHTSTALHSLSHTIAVLGDVAASKGWRLRGRPEVHHE